MSNHLKFRRFATVSVKAIFKGFIEKGFGKDKRVVIQRYQLPDEQEGRAGHSLHSELPGESGTSSGDFKNRRKD